MKDLKATRGSSMLHRLVAEGEHVNQDFKFTINDPRKIARSVSAFANNRGGRLLIGVDDNGKLRGVRSEEDIYVVESAATTYCSPECEIEFTAYKEKGGAVIIIAEVKEASSKPVYVLEEKNIRKAYYRVADENLVAHPLLVKYWTYTNAEAQTPVGTLIGTDSSHDKLIKILSERPHTPEELKRRLDMSEARLENTVIQLLHFGVLDFVYDSHSFKLILKGGEE